jgi:hypothetical protein
MDRRHLKAKSAVGCLGRREINVILNFIFIMYCLKLYQTNLLDQLKRMDRRRLPKLAF